MVSNFPPLTSYVDYSVLGVLAKLPLKDDDQLFEEWQITQNLWGHFQKGKVKLVTSGDDTEIDIILRLNREGCCIFDTLMVPEAIEEFENWGKVDKGKIEEFKRIFHYYEQLDMSPVSIGEYGRETADLDKKLLAIIRSEILCSGSISPIHENFLKEDYAFLKLCLSNLDRWYGEDLWCDLRHTEYQLNWEILESILSQHGIKPVFEGAEGARNRHLFGLLCRAIGFSKKSCPKPSMDGNHIDFVIKTVMQKYNCNTRERTATHIYHCIKHQIQYFLTTDYTLITEVNSRRHLLSNYPEFSYVDLELVGPLELESIITQRI